MKRQTFTELSKVVLKEFICKGKRLEGVELQRYFYHLKSRYPGKYEKMSFNENTLDDYFSNELSAIIFEFKRCGFIGPNNNVIWDSMGEIKSYLDK